MVEYIEREAALDCFACDLGKKDYSVSYQGFMIEAAFRINSIPAADVRPVVTCGKCKYGKYTGTEWFCDKHSGHADKFGEDASYHEYHSKHWFCADGEKREES
jgi:hypothetical protein